MRRGLTERPVSKKKETPEQPGTGERILQRVDPAASSYSSQTRLNAGLWILRAARLAQRRSMASTPSPSKPAISSELAPGNSRSSVFHATGTTQGRGRKKSRTQPVQRSEYDEILDPVGYTKKLEGILPKRHVKRIAVGGSKRGSRRVRGKVRDEETISEDEPLQKHKPSAKANAKPRVPRARVRASILSQKTRR
ncbi:hypothetical protein OE88DRAFT_1665507 [Heliocybe sulcata]|uniref:Uncharacterized protein n=1 Tax=Heliocybe sulcata TaxID=5364 RepID=A0A5C3MQZ5_9AGAM|nr:hypothetical protein OE88DRAFT_1665507 [Heliocybe sulcata]